MPDDQDATMDPQLRRVFDQNLEQVLPELPDQVRKFMEQVPMIVEDYPSPAIMRRMRVRHRAHLCGLYTGIPLIQRSIAHSGVPSDVIHIYRLGILCQSRQSGGIDEDRLRNEIRRTILHEYGHHVGLDERELREFGYG